MSSILDFLGSLFGGDTPSAYQNPQSDEQSMINKGYKQMPNGNWVKDNGQGGYAMIHGQASSPTYPGLTMDSAQPIPPAFFQSQQPQPTQTPSTFIDQKKQALQGLAQKYQGILQQIPQEGQQYATSVINELDKRGIADPKTIAYALATMEGESNFQPKNENGNQSYFNKYDFRKDLGNTQAGDGYNYRGRGLIQLTGKANYANYGNEIGLGDQLVQHPELANDPTVAPQIFAQYFQDHKINDDVNRGLLTNARKQVNGGLNGIGGINAAYQRYLQGLGQ